MTIIRDPTIPNLLIKAIEIAERMHDGRLETAIELRAELERTLREIAELLGVAVEL